jgi:hypothetical protein
MTSKSNGHASPYPHPLSDGLWIVLPRDAVLWIARVIDETGELTERQLAEEIAHGSVILALRPIYVVTSKMVPRVAGGEIVPGTLLVHCARGDLRYGLPDDFPSYHVVHSIAFLSDMTERVRNRLARFVHDAEVDVHDARSPIVRPDATAPR